MARTRTSSTATRVARLEERVAELRRARAGDQGPVVVYEDDDEQAVQAYVEQRGRIGAELVVVVRSLARRPAEQAAPWRAGAAPTEARGPQPGRAIISATT